MTPEQLEKLAIFHTENQRKNIAEIRNWILQLSIISGAIIGFTLPVLGSSPLIKNSCLLVSGLFLLWIDIILGLGYLRAVLSRENNRLAEQIEDLIKNHNVLSSIKKDGRNYILDILYFIFVIATLLIIISMIDF
ncbi:hypothetical protein A3G54_00185 [Candidatus Giovannonibacteria bacterium RIFCSPLOWO2_12_FULL_44_15]|uniref:Uncharacterized protein n=1 Tax=Candidatus Giovannonibacteria bacterium RIFCSPLOWO2_12_FULL_44_15 TaxID=1798364 RepID=A0A1F5XZ19_9BACT|nr:MAG: hypothetical protein A3G54_00185 [Candidatus Giovannonibacteria bacterium RIFCSPLOWO2_12_FULL_44_15]